MRRVLFPLLSSFALAGMPACVAAQGADPDRRIVKQVVVKASLEDAWKAWTTSEGIVSFFAPEAKVEPRPGGAFHVHFNPYARPGLKGADDMTVMAVQEKRLFSFTWNSPPYIPEVREQRTSVQVRFRPLGEKETEVRLVHGGWGEGGAWDKSYEHFDRAWGNVLANLQKRFAEGPVDWSAWLKRMRETQDAENAKAAGGKS